MRAFYQTPLGDNLWTILYFLFVIVYHVCTIYISPKRNHALLENVTCGKQGIGVGCVSMWRSLLTSSSTQYPKAWLDLPVLWTVRTTPYVWRLNGGDYSWVCFREAAELRTHESWAIDTNTGRKHLSPGWRGSRVATGRAWFSSVPLNVVFLTKSSLYSSQCHLYRVL